MPRGSMPLFSGDGFRPIRVALLTGVRDILPLLVGVAPFALVFGVAAMEADLSVRAAMGLSLFVYAGAAQLAIAQLIGAGATVLVIAMTALAINLRFSVYSASLAPHLHHLPRRWKWPLAHLLTDQVYAVSITRYQRDTMRPLRHWYYLGAALAMWVTWQVGTVAGILLGTRVSEAWGLDFAVPLTFLGLLANAVDDGATLTAAVAGGLVAAMAVPLPFNLSIIAGALTGVGAGVLTETRFSLSFPPSDSIQR